MQGIRWHRLLIGAPLATDTASHQRLSKVTALAVFSSDALSSTAYATEAILSVLIIAGTGVLFVSLPIALGIAALLLIVSFSYYQTIHAYPGGGGAYIVANENLGVLPGLVAAAALLIDYTLTVAVSISAGVAALVSAFPVLAGFRVPLALAIAAFITIVNLRGTLESGTVFAIPTYAFIVGILAMIGVGVVRILTGSISAAVPGQVIISQTERTMSALTLFIVLRAYAAGCTALTGVEAISNGVLAFRPPESRNAGRTLIAMVLLLVTMFVGISLLANHVPISLGAHAAHMTVLAQINAQVFGAGSPAYFYVQFATLLILSLAANTAFADFPRLASLIARDRYLPRQLTNWGDRLVYNNGILSLLVLSAVLIVAFGAYEQRLLPLYAVGVFISFTLSQSGMVMHWLRERRRAESSVGRAWHLHLAINGIGACSTAAVGVILMVTKFSEGAWIVITLVPIMLALFWLIRNHYVSVAHSLTLDGIVPHPLVCPPDTPHHPPMIVLLNSLNRCTLQALEYAVQLSTQVRACAIDTDAVETERLRRRWAQWPFDNIPLDIIASPYREIGRPMLEYLHRFDDDGAFPAVVVLPEFVVSRRWHRLLHNHTSAIIREVLYADHLAGGRGRPVIVVPYRIGEENTEG